jgi:peptide deformylase
MKAIKAFCLVILILASPALIFGQRGRKLKKKEITLIESGMPTDTLRVLKITNKKDSMLLRKQCKNVSIEKNSGELRYFARRLAKTMTHPKNMGVGIAAPQVGLLRNIICVQRFDKENTPVETYFNPRIKSCSDSTQVGKEGCLSIPDKTGLVKRYSSITIEYIDLDGKLHLEKISGFTAVIFQHEIDHLNGILFLDHINEHDLKP